MGKEKEKASCFANKVLFYMTDIGKIIGDMAMGFLGIMKVVIVMRETI
jgi:hypothetical protein